MPKLLLAACLTPFLFACASQGPAFNKMSLSEIAAYNASVEFDEQVICIREVRAGTHIKRRYCETIAEMQNNLENSYQQLNVVNVNDGFFRY